jgi:DNA-binding YbaB/EbfC family protein
MFDALKNIGNIGSLMSRAKEMQEKMKILQEELGRRQITADAGDGRVTATVNGAMQLLSLRIDKTRVDTSNTELLEAMTVTAVAAAQAKAAELVKSEMAKLASDMGLPANMLPGMS